MSRPLARCCLAALLLLAVPATAGAANAAMPTAPQAINFAKGSDQASVKGKFKAPATISREYTVELQAGDEVEMEIKDDREQVTFFNVFPPGAPQREREGRSRQKFKAQAGGTYTIHAFMTRSAVERKESTAYRITIQRTAAKS